MLHSAAGQVKAAPSGRGSPASESAVAQATLPIDDPARVPAPAWTGDLVIYERNPRGFTSPRGVGECHGSRTFRSTAERIPYLADLGVNAIWIAGFHEATAHFYGIWSTYAASRFDRVDPALGTMDDFAHLIRTPTGTTSRFSSTSPRTACCAPAP